MTDMVAFDDTVARTIETMYTTADVVQQRRAQPPDDLAAARPGSATGAAPRCARPPGGPHGVHCPTTRSWAPGSPT